MDKPDNVNNTSDLNEKDSFLNPNALPDPTLKQEKTVKFFNKDTNLTRTQLVTLTLITLYFLLASSYYALFAPFLPG